MEGGFVICEIGGELQPVRVKAPPQKRRAVIRVELAETQNYVLVKKKLRTSALFRAQSVSRDEPCVCAALIAEKRA